jgi:RNA polymerase sigma factor (sigma-70 family)
MSFRPLKDLSDDELLKRFKASSENEYQGELFHRYSHLVFLVCRKYLRDPKDAEDAAMEIFERLPGQIVKWSGSGFQSWLWVMTKNYCFYKLKKNSLVSVEEWDDFEKSQEFLMHFGDDDCHLDDRKEKLLRQVEEIVRQLEGPQKTCIELFYFEEKSLKEIMEITHCSWDQVRSHIQNGRRNMKNRLERMVAHVESA